MDPDKSEPRPRLVTINQVVAWNIAWYRKQAGMTQLQVAELLGWPQNRVSEAERSWDGKRTREFDAQIIADFAAVFGVPVVAFFLPPLEEADGLLFAGPDGDPRTMTDLMWLAMHDNDDETPALAAYRKRFRVQAQQYTDQGWPDEVDRWFAIPGEADVLADRAAALRAAAALAEETAAAYDRAAARSR